MWKKDRNILLFIILLLLGVLLFAWGTGKLRWSVIFARDFLRSQIQVRTSAQPAEEPEEDVRQGTAGRAAEKSVQPETADGGSEGSVRSGTAGTGTEENVRTETAGGAAEEAVTGQRADGQDKGRVALTFDDGPHPVYTLQLLEGLAKRNVKASFFITGQNAEEYPDLVRRMHEEGHLIGNHTYSHLQLNGRNREAFRAELVKTNEIIKEITGEEVVFVRPPYGSWDKKFEEELNMFPVLWTVDPLDWCSSNVSCVVNKVLPKVKENSIILMHDEYASTVTAALKIVDELQSQGYEFVTVDEILFD